MELIKPNLSDAIESARTIFAVDSPFMNFVVTVFIAYIVIYFITFHLGPILFGVGTFPHRPIIPIFARKMHHVTRREAVDLDDEAGMELTERVMNAIDETD